MSTDKLTKKTKKKEEKSEERKSTSKRKRPKEGIRRLVHRRLF
jgi:hypothetical protein